MSDDPKDEVDEAPTPPPASSEGDAPSDLSLPADLNDLTVAELEVVARRRNIEGISSMDKAELVDAVMASLQERPPAI